MKLEPQPEERAEFDVEELARIYPPRWHHPNKKAVYSIACPEGAEAQSRISYSRWQEMSLPSKIEWRPDSHRVEGREDVFDYLPAVSSDLAVEWHLNFADPRLFVAYSSGLFAQDEMQVAEHPALGSLKEALEASGRSPFTVRNGKPTPILIMGVPRHCRIEIDRNPAEGRPDGLYGSAFGRASVETVQRAATRLVPPTLTNVIAMTALRPAIGKYSVDEIRFLLVTAFTAFQAAKLESTRDRSRGCQVIIHTGFWGCGAFGGNRILMALLQVAASAMAGVDKLVFHTVDQTGTRSLEQALTTFETLLSTRSRASITDAFRATLLRVFGRSRSISTLKFLSDTHALGFEWGRSDGN
ncbi:MAG: poly(ADP-ribose) glycohydrolase [Verrucomicrobia subdivision 3 bacterium]|nr:poly(ADP-ribose) glycohydrolase [Limisphaerales bacterium]